jgi:hypothetical protein
MSKSLGSDQLSPVRSGMTSEKMSKTAECAIVARSSYCLASPCVIIFVPSIAMTIYNTDMYLSCFHFYLRSHRMRRLWQENWVCFDCWSRLFSCSCSLCWLRETSFGVLRRDPEEWIWFHQHNVYNLSGLKPISPLPEKHRSPHQDYLITEWMGLYSLAWFEFCAYLYFEIHCCRCVLRTLLVSFSTLKFGHFLKWDFSISDLLWFPHLGWF